MKKIKNLYLAILGLFIFVVGCEVYPPTQGGSGGSLPYILSVSPKQDIMSVDEPYNLKFFVVNPMISSFIGNLTYKYDITCFRIEGSNTEGVQVNPKSQLGYTKTFKHNTGQSNVYPYREGIRTECLQKVSQISVYLYDAGGDLRSSAEFLVTQTQ